MQWCTLHSFTEAHILNRFVFHLGDMAQQWYLAFPSAAKTTLPNLKESFFVRFLKTKNSFDIDVLNIRQQADESAEGCITRMVCDEDIPNRMLINLIAKGFKSSIAENVKGFKSSIAEKVLDKDPEIIEDLFKFSKRAEST